MKAGAASAAIAGLGPAPALLRLVSCSWRQAAISGAMLLLIFAAAWHRQAQAWLALFAALLAALAIASALMALVRLVLSPQQSAQDGGWGWAWGGLAAGLAAGAGGALLVYRGLIGVFGIGGLGDGRVFGSALGLCVLLLAVPLVVLRRQSQALQLANLRQAALSAELKSLQAQVEPHFLYNTLANTRYLARHEPAKAVDMLDHLIAYLHTALPDMRTSTSTLGRECQLAEHYLALMAIRFGERMTYEVVCPPGLLHAAMPPLMLMSLVENAVRHGVEAKPGAVRVRVSAAVNADSLHVLVADSGAGLAEAVFGSGVGLRNVRERLAAQYGALAGFELRTGSGGQTEAELRLPLVWSEAPAPGGRRSGAIMAGAAAGRGAGEEAGVTDAADAADALDGAKAFAAAEALDAADTVDVADALDVADTVDAAGAVVPGYAAHEVPLAGAGISLKGAA